MDLKAYIGSQRGNATRLAASLAISPQYLSQMASGYRPVPAEYCPLIEHLTDGSVRCESLRPDIAWELVRGTQGVSSLDTAASPAVEGSARAA
jgi:DNA-binding transcriptional regulator YdaS (Cro superfamily)